MLLECTGVQREIHRSSGERMQLRRQLNAQQRKVQERPRLGR